MRILRYWLVLAGALQILGGCTLARDALYRPRHEAIDISRWTSTSRPEEIRVVSGKGTLLQGFYWPGVPGNRDMILFFHGRHAHQGIGAKYAQYFAGAREAAVMVASYRGFGANPGHPARRRMLEDAAAFTREARARCGERCRLWFVGHSLGGAVALEAANADGHAAGVITIATFARIRDAAPPLLRPFLPDRWDNLAAARTLTAPLVAIQGSVDKVVPSDSADRLYAAARGPVAEIRIAGMGHSPNMQAIGPWVRRAIPAIGNGQGWQALPPLPDGWSVVAAKDAARAGH
ncbi:MAG TPA: alpha/beta fold hydrolase [Novosphingobium sp.]|nr:alpha/beta fold hydrolase [Novosphingobium sp.]